MLRLIILCTIVLFSALAQAKPESSVSHAYCLTPSVVKLSQHPIIIKRLTTFNARNDVDPAQIDSIWPYLSDNSPYIVPLINNSASQLLRAYISQVSLTGEGFLIGLNGGLAATTNRTTDYWQGDEEQFLQAINLSQGSVHIINSYTDLSADSKLDKISTPIFDTTTSASTPIGVLVIGFDSFVLNFKKLCDQPSD